MMDDRSRRVKVGQRFLDGKQAEPSACFDPSLSVIDLKQLRRNPNLSRRNNL